MKEVIAIPASVVAFITGILALLISLEGRAVTVENNVESSLAYTERLDQEADNYLSRLESRMFSVANASLAGEEDRFWVEFDRARAMVDEIEAAWLGGNSGAFTLYVEDGFLNAESGERGEGLATVRADWHRAATGARMASICLDRIAYVQTRLDAGAEREGIVGTHARAITGALRDMALDDSIELEKYEIPDECEFARIDAEESVTSTG